MKSCILFQDIYECPISGLKKSNSTIIEQLSTVYIKIVSFLFKESERHGGLYMLSKYLTVCKTIFFLNHASESS